MAETLPVGGRLVSRVRPSVDSVHSGYPARLLQVALCLLGVIVLVWPWFDPRFKNPAGSITAEIGIPTAFGLAFTMIGCALLGPWRRFAFWVGVALVGHAVALRMVNAGTAIHYQHYYSPETILMNHPVLAACVVVQAILVVIALAPAWARLRAWTVETLSKWRLTAIALVFILSSAAVSRSVAAFGIELVLASIVQAINLGAIIAAVTAFPPTGLPSLQRNLRSLLGSPDGAVAQKATTDRFTLTAALAVTIVSAMLSIVVYERHPHLSDEVIYLYHAQFLASGVLTMPAPPVPAAFELALMQQEASRWYPAPPPGWPAMLALGVLLGVPWLVNPVLAGLNVILSSALLRRLYDRRTTRLALLLLCVSPWHLFMSMNFMTHTFTLTCTLAAGVWLAQAAETGRALRALLAGTAVGMLSLIRPLDGFITAAIVGVWYLATGFRRLTIASVAALLLGATAVGAIVLPYNQHLSGDPTVFPIMAYNDQHFGPKSNAYGFGPERGMNWPIDAFPGHGPIDGLINANLNTFSLNVELFGWPTGSLLLPALVLLLVWPTKSDWLMMAVIIVVFVAYFFYYFSGGPDFGARYWYLMLVPLVALGARSVVVLEDRSGRRGLVYVAVLALAALTLTNYIPWRAMDKYWHYLDMRADIRRLAELHGFGRSLVLIAGKEFPDFASAMAYNPVDLRANVPVYAWDRDPDIRRAIVNAYSDRPVWFVDGPTRTAGRFKVVAGPMSPADAALYATR